MILYGASGHAKVIIDILEKCKVNIDYLVDDDSTIQNLQGYAVVDAKDFRPSDQDSLIVSIGNNRIRKQIAESLKLEFSWGIHPSAILGDDVSIDVGTVIMAGAVINSSTSIGAHCIINTTASIDHDCQISDYVHISPNTTLCGSVSIGEGTHIGANATIIPNIKIGKWATIGAGAVIIEDVPDGATIVGNPGRIIKTEDV